MWKVLAFFQGDFDSSYCYYLCCPGDKVRAIRKIKFIAHYRWKFCFRKRQEGSASPACSCPPGGSPDPTRPRQPCQPQGCQPLPNWSHSKVSLQLPIALPCLIPGPPPCRPSPVPREVPRDHWGLGQSAWPTDSFLLDAPHCQWLHWCLTTSEDKYKRWGESSLEQLLSNLLP